jgi:hypothetical protein
MKENLPKPFAFLLASLLLLATSCHDDPVLDEIEANETDAIHNGFNPTLVDQNLRVSHVISELITPISIALWQKTISWYLKRTPVR